MDINRSGYYKWLHRKNTLNQYQQRRAMLTKHIHSIHQQFPSYGYHDLASQLRKHNIGFSFSDHLVHKCCQSAGITSKAKHYRQWSPGKEHHLYENKIRGKWNAKRPLEIVVSDMTVLKNKDKHYEWTYFLDTFNNEIIASHLSAKLGDIKPYYQCLDDVLQLLDTKKETAPLILHTDQGAVYASRAYYEAHQEYNIIRSMSRAGTPTDNPIIESLNGWIKAEMACDFNYQQIDEFELFMDWYVDYFNTERPAAKLKYKTPHQFKTDAGFL